MLLGRCIPLCSILLLLGWAEQAVCIAPAHEALTARQNCTRSRMYVLAHESPTNDKRREVSTSRSVSSVTTELPEMSSAVRFCRRTRQARNPMSDNLLVPTGPACPSHYNCRFEQLHLRALQLGAYAALHRWKCA